jgi:predicted SAM-dependent methyltransferase
MISRRLKAVFYGLLGPAMKINGNIYKTLKAPKSSNSDSIKVHLGPGQKSYLKGWINVDANFISSKIDVWADLRNALPFNDNSINIFYSHHVIEHLPNLEFHFAELFRCLKPNGKIRIAGPNGDAAMKKFLENDYAWFPDFPDERKSIGGRFENFIFARQEHLTILTFSHLQELLTPLGFRSIAQMLPKRETQFPELIDDYLFSYEWETDFDSPHTLVVEAEK